MEMNRNYTPSNGRASKAAPVNADDIAISRAQSSSSLQEIISRRPGSFVRNGNLIIILAICGLLSTSWVIHYPDTLQGTATITTAPFPLKLQFPAAGRLQSLYVKEGEELRRNMPVVELENPTGYEAVVRITATTDSVLSALQRGDIAALHALQSSPLQSLGEAQTIYNSLLDAIGIYVVQAQQGVFRKRAEGLQSQINRYESLSLISAKEQALMDEELRQADERYKANEQLYVSKVISRQEYFDEAARLRQKKLALEQQRRAGLQNRVAIADNAKQLQEVRFEHTEKQTAQIAAIRAQARNLQNFVQEWKQKYLLMAPFDGKVHYSRPLQIHEAIDAGESICAVVPSRHHYIALIQLPAHGMGKLAVGQEVHLSPDQFPYNEYGYITARVEEIAAIPQQSKDGMLYQVRATMEDTLRTSYGRTLPFVADLSGEAVVITKDRNLLERLLASFARGQR